MTDYTESEKRGAWLALACLRDAIHHDDIERACDIALTDPRLSPQRPEACAGFRCGGFLAFEDDDERQPAHAPGTYGEQCPAQAGYPECICANCNRSWSACNASREPASEAATDDCGGVSATAPERDVTSYAPIASASPQSPLPEPATEAHAATVLPERAKPVAQVCYRADGSFAAVHDYQRARDTKPPEGKYARDAYLDSDYEALRSAAEGLARENARLKPVAEDYANASWWRERSATLAATSRRYIEGEATLAEMQDALAGDDAYDLRGQRDAAQARAEEAEARLAEAESLHEAIRAESVERREKLEAAEAELAEMRARGAEAVAATACAHGEDDDCDCIAPCPFCGCPAALSEVEDGENVGGQFIECTSKQCGASTRLIFNCGGDDVHALLRETWNTRPFVDPVGWYDPARSRPDALRVVPAADPNAQPLYAAPPPAGAAVTWFIDAEAGDIELPMYWRDDVRRLLGPDSSCVLRVTREPKP